MRLTAEPLPITWNGVFAAERFRLFLGHYDLRVFLSDRCYVDVGRGSFDAVLRITRFDDAGYLGAVGQFCNFAENVELLAGGEHHNQLPVNITFGNVPAFDLFNPGSNQIPSLKTKPAKPFHVGHGVVMSWGAVLLTGSAVGDGAVLGASAVVAGEIAPFTVAAGVPAKPIKLRFAKNVEERVAHVRWWDFDIAYLGNNLARLQDLAVDVGAKHIYRKAAPQLAIRLERMGGAQKLQVFGMVVDDAVLPLSEAPKKARDYLDQFSGPGPYYWLADMWN